MRRPAFRRLAASYAVNEIGDWFGIVALSVLVYDETGSALATAALFIGTRFLPALLAPILVARSEQPEPRFALPVIYCGQAVCFCGLALVAADFSLPSLPLLVAIATLDGALALTGRSLTRGIVATLLEPRGELRAGNAILNVAFTGGAAVGPALAGAIVAGFGVQTALLLDALSFYLIAVLLLTASGFPAAAPDPGRLRERVREGLAYAATNLRLRRLLIAQSAAFVFFATVIPVEVIYAKDTLGAGDGGYGLLLASWGAGMVLGSVLFALLRARRLSYLFGGSTLLVGVAYLVMSAAPTLAAACAAAVIGGLGNGIQWVSAVSAAQELTRPAMQARVMSLLESAGAAMPGLGFVIGGAVAATLDPRAAFALAGAGVICVAAATAWLASREGRLRPRDPVDDGDEGVLELRAR